MEIFRTGRSGHHKLILSFFCSQFLKILPETTENTENIGHSMQPIFLHDLDKEFLKEDNKALFSQFTQTFQGALDKHNQ